MRKVFTYLKWCLIVLVLWIADAWILGRIDPQQSYGWLSGCWQGTVVVPNYIMSLFDNTILYKAAIHDSAYDVAYYVTVVALVISLIYASVRYFMTR